MQTAAGHDTADVVEADKDVQPGDGNGFEKVKFVFKASRKPAKFITREIKKIVDCQRQHRFLHQTAAPTAALDGGRCDGGGGRTRRAGAKRTSAQRLRLHAEDGATSPEKDVFGVAMEKKLRA
ncbi:hypothetical protein XH99_14445 [Bradyrhizobium nanningense]|uniref:Uncharacterized protein n=1 Tax=Bradyrhizobium nanningense TaxID=1325118 RepID=A0A4Q0S5Y6_9BRAD|nr:hypothetical protein XH99_14445 [Bradyrhizobium nanningense]